MYLLDWIENVLTIQGYTLTLVSTPPIILDPTFGMPQIHIAELWPVLDVVPSLAASDVGEQALLPGIGAEKQELVTGLNCGPNLRRAQVLYALISSIQNSKLTISNIFDNIHSTASHRHESSSRYPVVTFKLHFH